jgi:3-dehydroquinate synthase
VIGSLTIASRQGDYRVDFAATVREAVLALEDVPRPLFVVDATVSSLYASELDPLRERGPVTLIEATERNKTLEGVHGLVTWMNRNRANARSTLVAVGGGIVQDIVTFSAHVYHRGIPWAFMPTTLLAMSDSCIGAKCGINLQAAKNQLGVFHSPSRVVVATAFIDTLSDADVASGYGEILKLALTGSEDAYERLRDAVDRDGFRSSTLPELIHESLTVKKRVIEADEYEKDLRRILNYGHTFGHALEAATEYAIPHGIAVAWGLDLVNFLSYRRGLLAERWFHEVNGFVRRRFRMHGRSIGSRELIDRARHDKKAAEGGGVNLILAERPGSLRIVPTLFDDQLQHDVSEYLSRFDAFRGD